MKKVNMSSISNKIKFIYGDECEKNTVGMVIFSNGTDYFFDAEYKNKMSNEEVEALLLRGAVIFKDGKYCRPTSFDNKNISFENATSGNDMPKLFFTGTLPTTKDNVLMELEYISNSRKFTSYIKIKCQGTSSMTYDKKNFTIALYSDESREEKLNVNLGWGYQNKYCLKANYVDTTHTRNITGARIATDMVNSRPNSEFTNKLKSIPTGRNGAVDGFPIKVYLNGEFYGIYTCNIPKDAWMFGMDEDNSTHWVICAEVNSDGNTNVKSSCQFKSLWSIDSSEWSVEVGEKSNDMVDSFNRCIDFVMNASNKDFRDNINEYFDLYSLLDYYCFSYICCHIDGLAKNMLMSTYDGKIWGACLYDMDSCFGATWNGADFNVTDLKCPEQYQEPFSLLWQRIERCFAKELKNRYFELRKSALSLANIINHAEEIYDIISDRIFDDEHEKWPNLPSISTNTITRFRNFMKDRSVYVDNEIMSLVEYDIDDDTPEDDNPEIDDNVNGVIYNIYDNTKAGVIGDLAITGNTVLMDSDGNTVTTGTEGAILMSVGGDIDTMSVATTDSTGEQRDSISLSYYNDENVLVPINELTTFDSIVFEGGDWHYKRFCNTLTITGDDAVDSLNGISMGISSVGDSTVFVEFTINDNYAYAGWSGKEVISNLFSFEANLDLVDAEGIRSNGIIQFRISKSKLGGTTIDDVKTWLLTHPLTVVYHLQTMEDYIMPDLSLNSYDGQTIVYTNLGNIEPASISFTMPE